MLEGLHVVTKGGETLTGFVGECTSLFRHVFGSLARNCVVVSDGLCLGRTEGDFDIFVAQEPFRLDGRTRIFLNDIAGWSAQIHHHGHLPVWLRRQIDLLNGALMNSANPNFGAIV